MADTGLTRCNQLQQLFEGHSRMDQVILKLPSARSATDYLIEEPIDVADLYRYQPYRWLYVKSVLGLFGAV